MCQDIYCGAFIKKFKKNVTSIVKLTLLNVKLLIDASLIRNCF